MKHEPLLATIFITWCVIAVLGGVLAIKRAPAVALALFGWVIGGLAGFVIGRLASEHGVPQAVALGSSIGLAALGLLGLVVTRATPPARTLKLAAAWVALVAPFALAATVFALLFACPLYVQGGYCDYDIDLLGGWMSGVAVLLVGDAIVLVIALLWSAHQARRSAETQSVASLANVSA
jgi:hypothetical protein